jgi:hypothetical protein
MHHRLLALLGISPLLAAAISLVNGPLAGQSPSATASDKPAAPTKKWTTPRTSWGEPDLQGKWSYATITPLERPDTLAGRDRLSDVEVAALNEDAQTSADRRDGSAEADLARAYNAYWYDRGKSIGRTSLIVDPPNGKLPPLTPEAQRRLAAATEYSKVHEYDSWEDRPLQERCITYHGVPPLPSGYNNTYQIFQTPGQVTILDENIHDVRVVPLDGRPPLSAAIRQWNGSSRGHWEGDTLVVETANYSARTTFRFPASGETLRAVERFTRVAAGTIDYRFTIHDPATYTRPWTVALPLMNLPDYVIFEYACHEGNYAIANALSGARALDRALAQAAGKN